MIKLEKQFTGGGEVVGFVFTQIDETPEAYLYQVDDSGTIHYEVFEKKVVNLFDFQNKCSLEETKESYPNANSFGISAWCTKSMPRAKELLISISERVKTRIINQYTTE